MTKQRGRGRAPAKRGPGKPSRQKARATSRRSSRTRAKPGEAPRPRGEAAPKRMGAKTAAKRTGAKTAAKRTGAKTAAKRTGAKTAAKRTGAKASASIRTPSPAAVERTDTVTGGRLAEYRRKRDFARTAEPRGGQRKAAHTLAYVIQKHAASHLHFDLRLELDGVMKSWAVPKGPSLDPSVKRLAMQVEDHPIEYNAFEGTIPQGEYGGGTVMIWDRGSYSYGGDDAGDPVVGLREGYRRGDFKFVLHGRRLTGSWVLVRTRRGDPKRAQWLLIKHRDEAAEPGSDVVEEYQSSVTTGRTMAEIAAGRRPPGRGKAAS